MKKKEKSRKITSKNGGCQTHDLLIDFCCQNGRPEILEKSFSHYTSCNLRDLAGPENRSKMEVQII